MEGDVFLLPGEQERRHISKIPQNTGFFITLSGEKTALRVRPVPVGSARIKRAGVIPGTGIPEKPDDTP
jgi:hypothetical protein